MKKNHCKTNFKGTIKHLFMLGTVLMFTAGVMGCSKLAPSSASAEQKQDMQGDTGQNDKADSSKLSSNVSENLENAGEPGKDEHAENPGTSKKGGSAMEDGNLADLLGIFIKDIESMLGKYDGNLDAAAKVGILTDYPGLTIESWNGAGEIYSVTLLDAENPKWNIFDIRPGDRMDEAINHITSLGAAKEPTGGMYDASEIYKLTYQEQTIHVGLSNGGSGEHVDTISVYFDANTMLGIEVSDEPEIDGMEMFDAASNPHIAELQEKYPNALVSLDAVTKQIQFQEEWLEAEVYFVDDMANGMYSFAYTMDGKLYQMIDGEWKPEN